MASIIHNQVSRASRHARRQLAATVYCYLTSPAIRTLAPSVNLLMLMSSAQCESSPTQVTLKFTSGWLAGEEYDWYLNRPSKKLVSLAYRKEKEGFRHEFIVVTLYDGTLCRFDRRADDNLRAYAPLEAGTTAKDTALILTTKSEIDEVAASELLLTLSFPDGEDLLLILAACYNIKMHPKACSYNLFLYNCYFFSWTVTCIAARRAVNWGEIARSKEPWVAIVGRSLEQLVSATVNHGHVSTNTIASPIEDAPKGESTWIRTSTKTKRSRVLALVPFKLKQPITHGDPVSYSGGLVGTLTPSDKQFYRDKFRDILHNPLVELRYTAESPFKNSLLRSQLEPALEIYIGTHLNSVATKAVGVSAALAAGATAMREITALYPEKTDNLNYKGFEWSTYCDVAWAAAYEAASAAETAQHSHWSQEWDRVWNQHWDTKAVIGDRDTHRSVGRRVCLAARAAWRNERTSIDAVRQEHLPSIIQNMRKVLLEHVSDIDDKRLKLGERASAKAAKRIVHDLRARRMNQPTQPPLQDYIRMRIRDHCEKVENFGFQSHDIALKSIEGVMQEIWIDTVTTIGG